MLMQKRFPEMPADFKPDEVLVGASYKDQDLGFIVKVNVDGSVDFEHFNRCWQQLRQGLWDATVEAPKIITTGFN